MRPIPPCATEFVAEREGIRLTAYLDIASKWTIGYGHTGPEVHEGLRWTKAQANAALAADLATAASRLHSVVKREAINELTEHQYAALLSFVLNLGADPGWTIWKRLNARDFDQVPVEMMRFVYATFTTVVDGKAVKKKRKVEGLVNRRAAEVMLWSTAEPGSTDDHLPSSVTREVETPPIPVDPVPTGKSAMVVSSALAAAASGGPIVNQAMQAVQPYAAHSELVQRGLGVLAVIGALLALLV